MLKTKSITKILTERLNEIGSKHEPDYKFSIFTEVGKTDNIIIPTLIQGILRRDNSANSTTAAYKTSICGYSLDILVPCPKGSNEHSNNVNAILDEFILGINGTYKAVDDGNALITIDGGVLQGFIDVGSVGERIVYTVRIGVQWTPNVAEDTADIEEGQIEIKLMKMTPYHNRTIDMNEVPVEVLKINSTIAGWQHDEVTAALKIKLPAVFNGEYNYVQITEFSGRVTKWFVLQKNFAEPSVWVHNLWRDLVRENWNALEQSPMYIEKATLSNDSPLIINKEQIEFNQIKRGEILLREQNCEWVYLYVQPGHLFTASYVPVSDYDINLGNADNPLLNEIILNGRLTTPNADKSFTASLLLSSMDDNDYYNVKGMNSRYDSLTDAFTLDSSYTTGAKVGSFWKWIGLNPNSTPSSYYNTTEIPNIFKNWKAQIDESEYFNATTIDSVSIWSGKRVLYKGEIYHITYNGYTSSNKQIPLRGTEPNWAIFKNLWDVGFSRSTQTDGYTEMYSLKTIYYYPAIQTHNFTVQKQSTQSTTVSFSASKINGMPYGIVAIPWDSYKAKNESGANITTNTNINRAIIGQLLTDDDDGDSQFIYDAQKLPYSVFLNDSDAVLSKAATADFYYKALIDDVIKKPLAVKNDDGTKWEGYEVKEPKIENQCDMWRLVSPNGSDTYEFSMVKNDGLDGLQLDMRLKPGKPFVMVSPNWKYLYGEDFDDYRGMVLSGDFSLPRGTSAWLEYMVNHKNYQLIQQRQAENMETNNAISNAMQKSNIDYQTGMGLMNSGIALLGGMASSNPTAIIGGLMGGLTTGLNYEQQMKNMGYNRQMQQEAINYSHDMFNYNIQNIKAQPTQIQRVDAFDANYKRFPFLEYYTCTPEEKEMFRNKLKYNGMTVMAIADGQFDKMTNYLSHEERRYFKSQLIRLEGNITANEFNALAQEFNKGLFLTKKEIT